MGEASGMTLFLITGALVASLMSPTTARIGAHYGPPADAAAIQAAFLTEHAKGRHRVKQSDIMAIAAYFPGGIGQVVYSYAGEGVEYFAQTSGGWRSIGATRPAYVPKSATRFFDRMLNLRSNGGKQCVNPKFIAVGSG